MNRQLLKIMSAILFAALFWGTSVFAQAGIGQRQMNQQFRIERGLHSGELTRKETRRLEREQAWIQHDKRTAKSDGVLTGRERAHIHREQDRASHRIYREKHDSQVRR